MKRMFDNLCQFKLCLDHFEDIFEMIVYLSSFTRLLMITFVTNFQR